MTWQLACLLVIENASLTQMALVDLWMVKPFMVDRSKVLQPQGADSEMSSH